MAIDKKLLWVHMNFQANGNIKATFSRQRFLRGVVVSTHSRTFVLRRTEMSKICRLTLALQRSNFIVTIAYGWDGYSVCEVRLQPLPPLTNRGVPIRALGQNRAN